MNDGHILVSNLMRDSIPQAILFERRGEKLGYRYLGAVQNSSVAESPEFDSDLESLTRIWRKLSSIKGSSPTKLTPWSKPGKTLVQEGAPALHPAAKFRG